MPNEELRSGRLCDCADICSGIPLFYATSARADNFDAEECSIANEPTFRAVERSARYRPFETHTNDKNKTTTKARSKSVLFLFQSQRKQARTTRRVTQLATPPRIHIAPVKIEAPAPVPVPELYGLFFKSPTNPHLHLSLG